MHVTFSLSLGMLLVICGPPDVYGEIDWQSIPLQSKIQQMQPMTGLVLWATNPAVGTAPIQLEYAYLSYAQIVTQKDKYDWAALDKLLSEITGRKHQAIIRWYDTYVGKPSGIPTYIQQLPDYHGLTALSEKKQTGFPDWSHPQLQQFLLQFFDRYAQRYDRDPRIAFVQVGFGLWSEYHIYDGPMQLGKTFPSLAFQSEVLNHLHKQLKQTPWMISVDAAGEHAPFATQPHLLDLRFGLFDDSFNHRLHAQENEPNWKKLGRDRWQKSPTGGEFSFFQKQDQLKALAPTGPHGISFEEQAKKFHISFMIADAQPKHQPMERLKSAGMAIGYRFRVTEFATNGKKTRLMIQNVGIAPIYYDAFPTVSGKRFSTSLKGLLSGDHRLFEMDAVASEPLLRIECDRLVPGQQIEYEADLK